MFYCNSNHVLLANLHKCSIVTVTMFYLLTYTNVTIVRVTIFYLLTYTDITMVTVNVLLTDLHK